MTSARLLQAEADNHRCWNIICWCSGREQGQCSHLGHIYPPCPYSVTNSTSPSCSNSSNMLMSNWGNSQWGTSLTQEKIAVSENDALSGYKIFHLLYSKPKWLTTLTRTNEYVTEVVGLLCYIRTHQKLQDFSWFPNAFFICKWAMNFNWMEKFTTINTEKNKSKKTNKTKKKNADVLSATCFHTCFSVLLLTAALPNCLFFITNSFFSVLPIAPCKTCLILFKNFT